MKKAKEIILKKVYKLIEDYKKMINYHWLTDNKQVEVKSYKFKKFNQLINLNK